MKKNKILAIIILLSMVLGQNLFAVQEVKPPANIGDDTIEGIVELTDQIWGSAILIAQVLSVGCVVFAGIRYMYASADKKADIKKGMMYLAIGAIFVFATTTVMKFVFNVGISLID